MASSQTLDIILRAKDEASATLQKFKETTDGVAKSFNDLNPAIQSALGALAAYAGSRGLGAALDAQAEQAKTLAQARFFLNGFEGATADTMSTLEKWGHQMMLNTGVSSEYATLIGAKLTNRVGDVNKAMQYSNTLLKLQQLGIINASEAANMMIRASDGNTRALRFLLEQMGIAAPEFSSLENLFAILEKRIGDTTTRLSPFATQMAVLKSLFSDLIASAATPLANALGGMLKGIVSILDQSPNLQTFIGFMLILTAAIFTLAGAFVFLNPVLAVFGLALSASAIMLGGAFVAAILAALFMMGQMGVTMDDLKKVFTDFPTVARDAWDEMVDIFGRAWATLITSTTIGLMTILLLLVVGVGGWVALFVGALVAIGVALALNWTTIVGYVSEGMLASYNAYATGWANIKGLWAEALAFVSSLWTGTWMAMQKSFTDVWDGITAKITASIEYLKQKLQEAQALFSQASSAVSAPIAGAWSGVKSMVKNVVSAVTPKAGGGSVMGGNPYLVGERGAEMFVPRTSGSIIPSNRLGGGGGAITLVIQGNSFMGDEEAAVRVGDLIVRRLQNVIKIGL